MDTETIQEFSQLMESRAHIYQTLSRCFETEMTSEFAQELQTSFTFSSDNDDLNEVFGQIKAYASDLSEEDLEEMAVVYDRVFYGMGPRNCIKAFPYESVYTSKSGYMMQEAYEQVKIDYLRAGFEKNPDFTEPEDHMAVELAFMAMLCTKTREALAEGNEEAAEALVGKQKKFVANHLMAWLDRFTSELKKAADEGFYAWLALGTRLFVHYDQEILNELTD